MIRLCLLLNLLLLPVQIAQARDSVLELISKLEPELRERAAAARRLAVPLDDAQFQQFVETLVRQRVPVHAESEECRAHSELVVSAITRGETWALRMFDAASKLPSGMLDGNFVDLGHYHECIGTQEPHHMFTGQHCLVETRGLLPDELDDFLNFNLDVHLEYKEDLERYFWPALAPMFSVCVPSSCSARDVRGHLDHVLAAINVSAIVYDSSCSTAKPLPFDPVDYVGISVFVSILALVVFCTISDTQLSKPKSVMVTAFSLSRNWRQLVDTREGSPLEDIPCMHGLRVLATAGIVLGHRFTIAFLNFNQSLSTRFELLASPMTAVAEILHRGVDVYLMIGGTVRAYSFFRDRYKGKPLDIFPSIGRRYLRYTPTLAVMMLFTATLSIHSGSGPMWVRFMEYRKYCCRTFWIFNVLQISNYLYPNAACVAESWYLSADFQMFIVSPLLLIPLYFRPRLGISLLTLSGVASILGYVFISYSRQSDGCTMSVMYKRDNSEVFTEIYHQSHVRIPPYLLGLGLGYLLFTLAQKNARIRLPKMVLWMGWTLSLVVYAMLLVATMIIMAPDYQYTPWLDVSHNVLCKFLVAAVTAWIVFVCSLGHGGVVKDFLCWKGFKPLARLALGVYLLHFQFLLAPQISRQTGTYDIDEVTIVYLWLGDLVCAFALAVPLYLCVELPFCKLASHYLSAPIPYDPIMANITAKRPRIENITSKTYHPIQSHPILESSTRKVKKKSKK